MNLTTIIDIAYLLLGPGAWAVLLFAMIKGRKRMDLLREPLPPLTEDAPPVCVLVPVKDEERQLRASLDSILKLDYPSYHIVAIDDRSDDASGAILDELAESYPKKLTAVHVRPGELPDGWAGKPHALHVGLRHAREQDKWLLFVDSDVTVSPDALRAAVAVCELKRYDLISLLPRLRGESFWERLIVPLCGAATSAMFLFPFTNYNELPRIAFANGQFMLVRRSAYEAIGGHEAVRDTFSEDVAIARKLKRAGFRPRLAMGERFISTRMYDSLGAVMRGWARNFFSGSTGRPWRVIGAIAFMIACTYSAFGAIGWGALRSDWKWIIAGVAHLAIIVTALALSYAWTGNRVRYALLWPLGCAMLIAIWLRSLSMCVTRRVEWRGTSYGYRIGRGVVSSSAR